MNQARSPVTRDDVAREAGVSPATVSYVINNGPRPVSPLTREKVLQAINKLGYQPNAVARSLRLQKTSILGLILPDTYNPYFAEVIRGVEEIAFRRGYSVMLCHSDYKLEREIQYVKVLRTERAAGVLWFPATNDATPAQLLVEYGIPLVVLDRLVEDIRVPSVVASNFRGGYLATAHLIELGHTWIGCISRPMDLYHSQERVRGYQAALQEYGLPRDEKYIVRGGFRLDDGRLAASKLLDLHPRPTAIFAYNDFMAIGALRACYEHGLQVPKDISIVGFDDIPQAAFTYPSLTTVRQPKFEMGCRGANLLLDLIDSGTSTLTNEPSLDVQLVIRESTGKAQSV